MVSLIFWTVSESQLVKLLGYAIFLLAFLPLIFGGKSDPKGGPQVRTGLGIDELSVDTNFVAGAADASFEDVPHTQIAANLLRIERLVEGRNAPPRSGPVRGICGRD